MPPLRRRVATVALLLLVPTLTACGFGAQTDQVYQPAVGSNNRDGQVDVLNALVVSDTDGVGTFGGTLVNKGTDDDKLVSITDGTDLQPVDVPGGQAVNLAESGQVRLEGDALVPGNFVPLTLQFASGQTTKIKAPVVQATGDYSEVPVGPTSTPTPKKPGKKASSTATSSPTQ